MANRDLRRHSQELLRFVEATHPSTVTQEDIDVANRLVEAIPNDPSEATYFHDLYPIEWAQKGAFKNFLRNWRRRANTYEKQATAQSGKSKQPETHVTSSSSVPSAPTKPPAQRPSLEDLSDVTANLDKLDFQTPTGLGGTRRFGPITFEEHNRTQSASFLSWRSPLPEEDSDDVEIPRQQARQSNMAQQPLSAEAAVAMMNAAMDAQRRNINQDIATLIAEAFRRNDEARPAPAANAGNNAMILKPADVGLFNPEAKDPQHLGMVSDGKMTVYTDVWAFTDRLKDLAATKDDNQVRSVWTQCLQGTALLWYSQVLTDADRELLRTASIAAISSKLLERFKPHYGDAMARWKSASYGLQDVGRKDILTYAQTMLRDMKACGMTEVPSQLRAIHESFDGAIKTLVPPPDDDTTLDAFLQSVRRHESTMKTLAAERGIQARRPYFANQDQSGKTSNTRVLFDRNGQPVIVGRNPYTNQPQNPFGGFSQNRPQYQNKPYNVNQPRQYNPPNVTNAAGNTQKPGTGFQPTWNQPNQFTKFPTSYQFNRNNQQGQQNQQADKTKTVPENRRLGWNQNKDTSPKQAFHTDTTQAGGGTDQSATSTADNNYNSPSVAEDTEEANQAHQAVDSLDGYIYNEAAPEWIEPGGDFDFSNYDNEDAHFVATTTPDQPGVRRRCRFCKECFPSNNKLHKHIRAHHNDITDKATYVETAFFGPTDNAFSPDTAAADSAVGTKMTDSPIRVKSSVDASTQVGTGFSFRSWSYLRYWITPNPDDRPAFQLDVCADTGCSSSLVDRATLAQHWPTLEIRKRAVPITVKGIGDTTHSTADYVIMDLHFRGTQLSSNLPAIATIQREISLVDNLAANMLVGMDCLGPEQFDILNSKGYTTIGSCNVKIPMAAWRNETRHKARVIMKDTTTVPANTTMRVPIIHSIRNARTRQDLLFEPGDLPVAAYALMANVTMTDIVVRNDTNGDKTLQRNQFVGHLVSIDPSAQAWMIDQADASAASELALREPAQPEQHVIQSALVDESTTITHNTGVKVFRREPDASRIGDILDEFAHVFTDNGFADVPEDRQLRVHFKPDWHKLIPPKCKVYPIGGPEQRIVEHTIDKLGPKLYPTLTHVPFSFPVFVIWREAPGPKVEQQKDNMAEGNKKNRKSDDPNDNRKGRMVIDVRTLNDMILTDAYPMKTQDYIIAKCADATHISTFDAMAFYYQWRVHPSSQWAFTITTHKGQFTFRCPVMGYKNCNAYVQRQMDFILKDTNSDSYCDDIVVASIGLDEHIRDLRQMLQALSDANISLGPDKSFVAFPTAVVLGKLVDSFGLTTPAEKLKAIRDINFPTTLRSLEHFLGLGSSLRHFVPRYAVIAEPLEDRKTMLLRSHRRLNQDGTAKTGKMSKPARKTWATAINLLLPTAKEMNAFKALRQALSSPTVLTFFLPKRQLYVEFDASGDGIGVQVFHVKDSVQCKLQPTQYPPRNAIEPIAFLSRTLSKAEKRYWSTELEVTACVWAIAKTQHWIRATQNLPVILFTDHKAIVDIQSRQIKDITNSTSRATANKKLIRAMEYISQFDIQIIHKPGNDHVVPDALSRLPTAAPATTTEAPGALEVLPDDRPTDLAFTASSSNPSNADRLPTIRNLLNVDKPPQDPVEVAGIPLTESSSTTPTFAMVELAPEFKTKLQHGYKTDPIWQKVLDVVTRNMSLRESDRADLPFQVRHGLIWKMDHDHAPRLCIPRSCFADIFDAVHNGNHLGYDKLSEFISQYCMHNGLKELRKYLKHCPNCAVFQIRRHKAYGNLQPILPPPAPYYMISIDFMLALPPSIDGCDAALITVCKLSKELIIIPGKTTDTADTWGQRLGRRLMASNWGFPKVILSDRDPKFLSAMWKKIWQQAGTTLLHATAYHPQTDGQTERTIQTIESAFRHYLHGLDNPARWTTFIDRLQFEYNCSKSATTRVSPNEAVKGFTPNNVPLAIARDSQPPAIAAPSARLSIHDAIAIAAVTMKYHYDRRHTTMFFNAGDKVYLRLHKGYNIPQAAILGPKYGQRYAGPFVITDRIGRSAYRIAIPPNWKIHDVVSIDHLEPAIRMDHYGRQLPPIPPVSYDDKSLTVNRIIQKRQVKSGTQYLVAYDNLGPEYHRWVAEADLAKLHDYDNLRKTWDQDKWARRQ